MSIHIGVNQDKKLLYIRAKGILNGLDIANLYIRLSEKRGVIHCDKALIDFYSSAMTAKEVPIQSIITLARDLKASPLLPEGAKVAFAIRGGLGRSVVYIYALVRGGGLQTRQFSTMGQAMTWLEISEIDILPFIS